MTMGESMTSDFSSSYDKDQSRNPVGLETDEERKLMPVAIVGMSCRLPGDVASCEEFWSMMSLSRDGWGEVPEDRFNTDAYWHPNPDKKGCTNARHGYFLNQDLAMFDAPFFNMNAQEAQSLDPQQRILLECTYEAFENAGMPKERIAGQRIGVFVGGATSDFRLGTQRDLEHTPLFEATGNHQAILAGRISYLFDLRGPSYSLDTACSSSINALHQAVMSIRAGESESAIVAAAHINLQPGDWVSMSLHRLFTDDPTYAFDNRAKGGFARGEGACTLILKPLDKALADNDKIRSIIVNTGANQDGRTNGISFPNGDAQEQLMREVYANANISPRDAGFVEAHGTGTKVGDPIEATAIHKVFGEGRTARAPLYMGSVKSNLGHLENASGLASVIKGAMMLEKGFILPNVHFQTPNEAIPLSKWNIKVPVSQRPWPGNKRFLSVNNFGFGGANAHCILERPPILSRAGVNPVQLTFQKRLFVISGQDETAARKSMDNLSVYLEQHPEVFQGALTRNLAYTLCERRSHLSWRFAMSAANSSDLNAALSNPDSVPVRAPQRAPEIAFVYTGQGAQWYAMGRELMEAYPVFAQTMHAADSLLKDFGADYSLTEELSKDKESSRVGDAYLSQPACTAVQLALTDLVKHWGIEPSSVTGHSSGEIGAAYAAGALSLRDAMAIAYHRGQATIRLKAEQPSLRGSMLAVGAGPDEVRPICEKLQHGVVVVACENSPSSITASGDETAITELAAEIESRQLFNRKLQVDVAYHSPQMQLVSDSYCRAIQDVTAQKVNKVSYYSSLRGAKISTGTLDAKYWTENLTCPVRFSTSLRELYAEKTPDVIIEIGPHSALEGPIKQILNAIGQKASKTTYLSVLSRGQDAVTTALNMAGKMFQNGHQQLNFARINREESTDLSGLPAGVRELQERPVFLHDMRPYPWSRQKYWYESLQSKQHRLKPFARHDLLGTVADFSNELAPTWRNVLRTDDLPWLRDHKMQSLTTFPFAGFVSMAIEAAAQRAKMRNRAHERFSFRELQVSTPLLLNDDAEYEISLSMSSYAEGTKAYSEEWDNFCISSWEESKGWTEHCRGLVISRRGDDSNAVNSSHLSIAARNFQEAQQACAGPVGSVLPTRFYADLDDKGANYGHCFQRLEKIRNSNQRSVAVIGVADTAATMPLEYETAYLAHPSLLDPLLQLAYPSLGAGTGGMDVLYMPSFIKELHIQPSKLPIAPGEKIQVACYGGPDFQTNKPVDFTIDALTCSEQPEAIINMTGLQMSPLPAHNGASSAPRELCYKIQWALADELVEPDSPTSPVSVRYAHDEFDSVPTPTTSLFSPWTVRSNPLSEYGDFSAQASEIDSDSDHGDSEGQQVDVVQRYGMPVDFGKGSGKAVTIVSETLHSKTVMKYLTAATLQRTGRLPTFCSFADLKDLEGQHVILSELEKPILSDMTKEQFAQVQKILTQAQGVLWVTNGAYVDSTNPTKAMSLGLTRTVRSETAARIATLDLDPSSSLKPVGKAALILQTFDKVFGQDANGSADMEYTERNGTLYVPRIVNDEEMNVFVQRELHDSAPYLQDFDEANRRLKAEVGTLGALDSIYFKDDEVEAPLGELEVEIEVKATGMNFKDVMVAMGLVRQPYLGIECAGVVSSIGSKVTTLAVGDRVCAMTHGAYSTFARCPGTSAAKIPQDMGYDIAASIPVAYCTAYYGIVELARLARGERILIHAAAGGVGQAAIQIAQMLGAEIFATVGSPEKKCFIMERYGIQEDRIFSSRDTSFAAAVKDATRGVGVDVVLNSLAGDMMRETWDCVAPFGRFIEIGKRDITSNTRLEMGKFGHNATFSSLDLAILADDRPTQMARMFEAIMSLFETKTLNAISPVQTFGISEMELALRRLQSGKSTGKFVVVPQPKEQVKATHRKSSRKLFDKDATYAIVGGTGGLGRSMTRWMVGKGAQNIVLLSRSGKTDGPVGEMIREINMLSNARVVVKSCDVADADSVSRVFRECDKELPPLRGIIHSSMVLKDTLFEKMTLEDFNAVIQSKVAGAWNIHSELLSAPLDFFLVISSTAGIVGNRGQAAYAAANTFLDSLAQYRMRHGLPGASIDLTAVSGAGYLAENAEREAEVLQNLGADPINEDEVLALVGAAISGSMEDSCNNHCITGLKLAGGAAQLPAWSEDGKFRVLRDAVLAQSDGTNSSSRAVSIGTQLARAESPEQALEIVASGVAEKLGSILVVPADDIDMTRSVAAYGLDSLNAIELRNWITKELGANLQILELLTSGSLPSLAGLIMKKKEAAATTTAKAE